jgi:hypothetical protein
MAVGIRHADHVAPSIRKSGGRSVGIVRSRTQAAEFLVKNRVTKIHDFVHTTVFNNLLELECYCLLYVIYNILMYLNKYVLSSFQV